MKSNHLINTVCKPKIILSSRVLWYVTVALILVVLVLRFSEGKLYLLAPIELLCGILIAFEIWLAKRKGSRKRNEIETFLKNLTEQIKDKRLEKNLSVALCKDFKEEVFLN